MRRATTRVSKSLCATRLDRGPDDETLSIPKYCNPEHGNVVALEVKDPLLAKAKITNGKYFELLARVS